MLKYLPMICLFTTAALAECSKHCPKAEWLDDFIIEAVKDKLKTSYETRNIKVQDVIISLSCDSEEDLQTNSTSCVYKAGNQGIVELLVPDKLKE